jgi:hypothetical protein
MRDDDVDLIVSVSDDQAGGFHQVVERLRRAGLRVTGEQPMLGTLTGRMAAGGIDALAALPGVAAVERAREYQLPPRDSELQ